MATLNSEHIIAQLNQARDLALSSKDVIAQVVGQIFNFVKNDDLLIQRWCAKFLNEVFSAGDDKIDKNVKTELAMDAIDGLLTLTNVGDELIFKESINTSVIVFKLVFQFIASNDGSNQTWYKLTELKNSIINKFSTTFPLKQSDNEEHDSLRSMGAKLEVLKFIVVVIDYQSRTSNNGQSFSLSKVSSSHTLIKPNVVEAEAAGLVDLLLSCLNDDIIVPQLMSGAINHSIVIIRRKPQFASKILSVIDKFDSNTKLQSNYQSTEQFKLAKKYIDRVIKNFLVHVLRNNLVPSNFQSSLSRKLNVLTERGVEMRRKNIIAIEDSDIRKRKFEGFLNPSKKLKTVDYKNLYCLTSPSDELNSFNLGTLPHHILVSMTIAALTRAKSSRLTKALEIISDRYLDAVNNHSPMSTQVKKEKVDEDDDHEEIYEPKTEYSLPPPQDLSLQEKKEHVALIIKNFFKFANSKSPTPDEKDAAAGSDQLTRVAIKTWKKDSWFILLTRLATRGMRTTSDEESPDFKTNQELSDMIRTAIFDYFLADIHSRVDLIIEWLNEEWYSERIFNENKLAEVLTEKYAKEGVQGDVYGKVEEEVSETVIATPAYDIWSAKVLDAMIPFLEPTDRKIFIRLLSDLPYLNEELVSRIQSLCFDPARSKIGFLALQYLIMYRPPVKKACIGVLESLSKSDQEDLRDEASKLLKKYVG